MSKAKQAVFHVLLAIILWSCEPWRPFPPPVPSPARNWTVVLAQSGGFAGVNLVVRVASDGEITAQDGRNGRETTKHLSDSDLKELERLLANVNLGDSSAEPSACADCFLYELEITGFGQTTHWRGDDTTLETSGMGDVIRFLGKLRDEALAVAI